MADDLAGTLILASIIIILVWVMGIIIPAGPVRAILLVLFFWLLGYFGWFFHLTGWVILLFGRYWCRDWAPRLLETRLLDLGWNNRLLLWLFITNEVIKVSIRWWWWPCFRLKWVINEIRLQRWSICWASWLLWPPPLLVRMRERIIVVVSFLTIYSVPCTGHVLAFSLGYLLHRGRICLQSFLTVSACVSIGVYHRGLRLFINRVVHSSFEASWLGIRALEARGKLIFGGLLFALEL